jgi:hypothetical protein
MNPLWVLLVYGSSFVLALVLLYFFHARWYWHALAVVAALAIGVIRFPPEFRPPDLVVGFAFFFLLVWGIGGPFVPSRHSRHVHRHA